MSLVPWFPKVISDLDRFADQIREVEVEQSPEYPVSILTCMSNNNNIIASYFLHR